MDLVVNILSSIVKDFYQTANIFTTILTCFFYKFLSHQNHNLIMPNSGLTSHGCILNVVMISQVDIISSSSYSYAEHRPKLVTHGFCAIITVLEYFVIEYIADSTEAFISAEQLCVLQKFRRFNRCRPFLSYNLCYHL